MLFSLSIISTVNTFPKSSNDESRFPTSPLSPLSPLGPCIPIGPCGPISPVSPFSPVGPWGPEILPKLTKPLLVYEYTSDLSPIK